MKRYWVEYKDHLANEYQADHVGLYMYAYSQDQIREALAEYTIITIDWIV